jgi:hypothetical protein
MLSFRFPFLVLLAASAGCSANATSGVFTTSSGAGGAGGGDGVGGAGTGSTSTGDSVGGAFTTSATGTGGSVEPMIAEVFGQSPDTLYKLDPTNNAVTTVGKFKSCGTAGGVVDIALDKDSNLYATTNTGLYKVDKKTAQCTMIAAGSYPNSLSFVPAGTVDATREALVGYLGADYVRIDTLNGKVTTIGQLSSGYTSSGDIVSVKDGKTLLTANGPDCVGGDCLLEVDPTTGDLVKNWGKVAFDSVFGLAFWAGKAYGFTNGGELFEINFTTTSITAKKITIPGTIKLQFWGAGSTTSAPADPIPQ